MKQSNNNNKNKYMAQPRCVAIIAHRASSARRLATGVILCFIAFNCVRMWGHVINQAVSVSHTPRNPHDTPPRRQANSHRLAPDARGRAGARRTPSTTVGPHHRHVNKIDTGQPLASDHRGIKTCEHAKQNETADTKPTQSQRQSKTKPPTSSNIHKPSTELTQNKLITDPANHHHNS